MTFVMTKLVLGVLGRLRRSYRRGPSLIPGQGVNLVYVPLQVYL